MSNVQNQKAKADAIRNFAKAAHQLLALGIEFDTYKDEMATHIIFKDIESGTHLGEYAIAELLYKITNGQVIGELSLSTDAFTHLEESDQIQIKNIEMENSENN